ncbi:MAG TPA: N-acetylglutaminylglutamine amidotransferase [Mariprofundaceae bacterium]|nr:N-acetylglutaminylglutamine amidotransferase [Mariprofundaceae bacterium]
MCGICGELRFSGQADPAVIDRMVAELQRRGPDAGGRYCDGPLAFGHRRLAIIDLSEHSAQPMIDTELKLALVFNGTIYNYRELRAELAGLGYRFFSDGDTEVILKAYHAWGEDCLSRLSGMFAFAIWDAGRSGLFLARDRIGIKPLYFSATAGHFRFASNTQALLAAGDVDTAIDPLALHYHFTLHASVPAPHTIFQGLRKLAPGHAMWVATDGSSRQWRYWQLGGTVAPDTMSEADWLQAVRAELYRAVHKRQVVADVPVGVLLSGGLDSSLLTALTASESAQPIQTFAIGFEGAPEEEGDEFYWSDMVARQFGTEHYRFRISNAEALARLPEAVRAMAEPMASQDNIGFYLLGEQVHRHVKVVQSGQGADEIFAGYFWYAQMQDAAGSDLQRFAPLYFDRTHAEFLETVAPEFAQDDATSALVAARLAGNGAFLDRVWKMDVGMLMVDDPVKRIDNMLMAWGIEARVPFLDHELVELALSMPASLKMRDGGKWPLKQLARELLPAAVIDRPKGYFPVPALKFPRGPFLGFMRELLESDACRQRGLFNRTYVEKLLAAPERFTTPLGGSKLWHLALLELWLQQVADAF